MSKINESNLSRNTLFFFLLTFLALTLYIFAAFLVPILLALIFTVTTYPLYLKLLKLMRGHRIWAAVTMCLLSFLVMLLILVGISWLLLGEFFNWKDTAFDQIVVQAQAWFNPEEWNKFIEANTDKIKSISEKIPWVNEELVSKFSQNILKDVSRILEGFSVVIVNTIRAGLGTVGSFLVNLIYFYLAILFFYIDGERALKRLFFLLPIKNHYITEVENRFSSLFKSWVIGNVAIMILQGILGGIGFALAGLPSPILWGLITTFAALIPFVGTTMIWLPAAIFLLISGHYFAGIFLIIWGALIVGTSDNIIRPIFLKVGAHLSLLILFFAILGGLSTFGFKGLLLGPIIVVFMDAILHIYSLEYGPVLKELDH